MKVLCLLAMCFEVLFWMQKFFKKIGCRGQSGRRNEIKNQDFDRVACCGGCKNDCIVFAVVKNGTFDGRNFDVVSTGTQEVVGGLSGG